MGNADALAVVFIFIKLKNFNQFFSISAGKLLTVNLTIAFVFCKTENRKIKIKSRFLQLNQYWRAQQALDLAIPSVARQRAAPKRRTEAEIHVGRQGALARTSCLRISTVASTFRAATMRSALTRPRRSCHSSVVFWCAAEVCACWRTMKSVWMHQGQCRSLVWCRPRAQLVGWSCRKLICTRWHGAVKTPVRTRTVACAAP